MNKMFFCAALASLLFASSPISHVSADDLDPVVEKLLVDYWDKGSKARAGSKEVFFDATPTEQVLLSYTLNRIKHNRYREARVPADELTRDFPKNLEGWMLRIWLDAVTDNYERSLMGMQRLKQAIVANANLEEATAKDLYSRVGRIVGYLQGPVGAKVNQATLNASLLKIVDGMTADQLKVFNEQRTQVLDQFDQLVNQTNNLEQQEKEKSKKAAEAEVAAIETQNKAMDARRQQIQPEQTRVRAEGEQRVAAVEARLSPVQQELAGLTANINSLELTLAGIFQERLIQSNFLLQENDPFVRALIRDRIFQLDISANAARNDLFNSRARIGAVSAQANSLLAERQRVGGAYANQLDQLSNEARQLNRQQRRNISRLQKVATGSQATSPKVRVANNRIDALSTYDPFPIEMARQNYLDELTGN